MVKMMKWPPRDYKPGELIFVKVAIRNELPNLRIKEDALRLDGRVYRLEVTRKLDDDHERYPGEFELTPPSSSNAQSDFDEVGITWIASGDVEFISYVEG